jgi:hypothetical protein
VVKLICSLNGYVADRGGDFSWARPDEEAHAFVNDLERPVGPTSTPADVRDASAPRPAPLRERMVHLHYRLAGGHRST